MHARTSVEFEDASPQPTEEVMLNHASLASLLVTVPKPLMVPDSWIMPAMMGSET